VVSQSDKALCWCWCGHHHASRRSSVSPRAVAPNWLPPLPPFPLIFQSVFSSLFAYYHTTTSPSFPQLLMVLTQEEIDACRAAFQAFDTDKTGTLDVAALRGVLGFLGQKPTEDELFMMIAEVDEGMSGMLDFGELLRVIEVQKAKALAFDDEGDMIDAFVACGGRADRQGHVKRETLVRIIKKDFGLMIDIEELINKVDTDGYVDRGGVESVVEAIQLSYFPIPSSSLPYAQVRRD